MCRTLEASLALDEAILRQEDPEASVVRLRFFAGLTGDRKAPASVGRWKLTRRRTCPRAD